jgi:hypothetical protein
MLLESFNRHFASLWRRISVELLTICLATIALAGGLVFLPFNSMAGTPICKETQAGAVERVSWRTLEDLIKRNAPEKQIRLQIEALPLPPFVKYFLIEGLGRAHKSGQKRSLENGLQHLIFDLGQKFMREHPEIQNDPEILQEIKSSALTDSFKWFLIDGVLAHNEINAWPRGGPILPPMEQLAFFESQVNAGSISRTSLSVPFPVKTRYRYAVTVETTGAVPSFIQNQFFQPGGQVDIPVHPVHFDNRTSTSEVLARGATGIPFLYEPTTKYWMAKLSASRSSFFGPVSIKIPTQFPNPTWAPENKKIPVIEDVRESLERTRMIDEMDARLGKLRGLILLKDVLAIHDHETGNAVLVRNTAPLLDGNYYMPAFSAREVGRAIARNLKVTFDAYWLSNYAYSWGQSKALLLIRYGLMLESSHEQQWLLQMKKDERRKILIPTGINVIRDLGDTYLVGPIAETIAPEWYQKDLQHRRIMNDFTDLNIASLADGHFLDTSWSAMHQLGIRETIESELGIKLPQDWHRGTYLSGDEFQAALRRYHHLPEPE